jgi:hypothetical protein
MVDSMAKRRILMPIGRGVVISIKFIERKKEIEIVDIINIYKCWATTL